MNEHRRPHEGNSTERSLHSDLEMTRAELAETLSALVDKVDVKSRAQGYLHGTQGYLRDNADRLAEVAENAKRRTWLRNNRARLAIAAVGLAVVSVSVRRLLSSSAPAVVPKRCYRLSSRR